jgi:hypothetical protein
MGPQSCAGTLFFGVLGFSKTCVIGGDVFDILICQMVDHRAAEGVLAHTTFEIYHLLRQIICVLPRQMGKYADLSLFPLDHGNQRIQLPWLFLRQYRHSRLKSS